MRVETHSRASSSISWSQWQCLRIKSLRLSSWDSTKALWPPRPNLGIWKMENLSLREGKEFAQNHIVNQNGRARMRITRLLPSAGLLLIPTYLFSLTISKPSLPHQHAHAPTTIPKLDLPLPTPVPLWQCSLLWTLFISHSPPLEEACFGYQAKPMHPPPPTPT